MVKNPPANAGDVRESGSIPGLERCAGEGNGNQLLPGKLHGQRSLGDYSPGGVQRVGHKLATKRVSSDRAES